MHRVKHYSFPRVQALKFLLGQALYFLLERVGHKWAQNFFGGPPFYFLSKKVGHLSFLQLPGQSQTKDGVGKILAAIDELKLQKGDFVYMDLFSNASFMCNNEDGLQFPPVKDGQKRWHITGSLVACPKPRIKKILSLFESLRESTGDAMLVCGLPLPRYVYKKCCLN